jgi:antitoxin ParD1/3/4
MTTLRVEISDATAQFLAEQAKAGGFESASEYLAALAAEAEANREAIEYELAEGVESGPAREMTPQDWDELKNRVRQRQAVDRGE